MRFRTQSLTPAPEKEFLFHSSMLRIHQIPAHDAGLLSDTQDEIMCAPPVDSESTETLLPPGRLL